MRPWHKYVVVLLASLSFHISWAQDVESAPQEPPFVQEENEFEAPAEDSDLLSIEDEIQNTEPEQKKATVDLNQQPAGDSKKLEEELSLEEEAAPVVEAPPPPAPKPMSSEGGVARSAKGGVEYIHHPQAAQGLLAITKDGSYIYKTKETGEFNKTGSFRMGMMDPPKIVAADGTTFDMMYSSGQQPVFMFDYEWQPFTGYGKLGVQAGFGLLVANGNGRFASSDPTINGQQAKEKYTFLAVPLSAGVVYRLEWLRRQWFAPYVAGGGTYVAVAEFRDDGKAPSGVGTPGAYGSAGMLFNVSAVDRETAFTLSSEYGIANLWVSVDYRYLQTFNEDLDFSSSIIGAGIVVDY
ncbi:MAG: hypothetical protein KUL82_09575 [Bdellovibrio sp.]|nr:hypothetical protein [Bdellovibrio sp.]